VPAGHVTCPAAETVLAANQTRPILPVNGGVRQVNVIMNLGAADYNGLQTLVTYRGNRRIHASLSYTFSKATNTSEPDGNGIGPNQSIISRLGEEERGPSVVDQRHRAVITFSYRFPFNITAGTLTQLASARPFNGTTNADNNGDGIMNDRPVVDGQVISKSAFRGTPTSDVAVFIEGRIKTSERNDTSTQVGRLQSLQSWKLSCARSHSLWQYRNTGGVVRAIRWRFRNCHDRDSGVCKHRPTTYVPTAGAIHLLSLRKSLAN
jgi:hypothetical protein